MRDRESGMRLAIGAGLGVGIGAILERITAGLDAGAVAHVPMIRPGGAA